MAARGEGKSRETATPESVPRRIEMTQVDQTSVIRSPEKTEPPQNGCLDFEIEVDKGTGGDYPVTVLHSAAGEARQVMRLPFDKLALENRLLMLQNALLRSGGSRRDMRLPEEQSVLDFGRALFTSLLSGEVGTRFAVSQSKAIQEGKALRLKLRILAPEIAALPWEFLYDTNRGEYVCLSRNTPLVRYIELPQPPPPFAVTLPLRILGILATPNNLPHLDVERERERIERAIEPLHQRGLAELTWLEGQTWRDVQEAMRGGPWHIVHFVGHGGSDPLTGEGLIALADENGQADMLRATQVARLLADHRPLRLVVLNACEGARAGDYDIFSSTAAVLVRYGIPAVLAMQYAITDAAAITFSRAFYEAICDGLPVDAAVSEARKAVSFDVENTLEWGVPVLFMRSPDGILFAVDKQGTGRPTPPPPRETLTSPYAQYLPPLKPIVPEAPSRAIPSGRRKISRSQLILIVALVCVVLGGVGVGIFAVMSGGSRVTQSPTGTTPGVTSPISPPISGNSAAQVTATYNTFCDALHAGDNDKAFSMLASGYQTTVGGAQNLPYAVGGRLGTIQERATDCREFMTVNVASSGQRASMTGEVTVDDNTFGSHTIARTFSFILVSNAWKIDNISS